jgi:hypothetical protein
MKISLNISSGYVAFLYFLHFLFTNAHCSAFFANETSSYAAAFALAGQVSYVHSPD